MSEHDRRRLRMKSRRARGGGPQLLSEQTDLQQILTDEATTRDERVVATAVLNLRRVPQAADKEKLEALSSPFRSHPPVLRGGASYMAAFILPAI